MRLFTLREGAERIAEHDPTLTTDYVSRQFRYFVLRRLIHPLGQRGSGKTAAWLIDENRLCRGRIGTECVRIGLPPAQVEAAFGCLDNPKGRVRKIGEEPPSKHRGRGFSGVLDAIREGEPWAFVLWIAPFEGKNPGVLDVSGGFYPFDEVRLTDYPDFAWNDVIIFNASRLLKPLLSSLAEGRDDEPDADVAEERAAVEP